LTVVTVESVAVTARALAAHSMVLPIQAQGLSKWYVSRPRFLGQTVRTLALDGVDLELLPGEVLALVGPNGAGKTTLLRVLAAMILPSSGSATVAGHPLSDDQRVKPIVGLASGDDRGFYGRLSVHHNLKFFGSLRGLGGGALDDRVAEAIQTFELRAVVNRPVQKLSTGERQRLSLARATLHSPKVLLLDEPTRGLDPLMTERVEDWLQRWLAACVERAALIASHDLAQVERISRRAAVLRAGRIATMTEATGVSEVLRWLAQGGTR